MWILIIIIIVIVYQAYPLFAGITQSEIERKKKPLLKDRFTVLIRNFDKGGFKKFVNNTINYVIVSDSKEKRISIGFELVNIKENNNILKVFFTLQEHPSIHVKEFFWEFPENSNQNYMKILMKKDLYEANIYIF